LYTDNDTTLNVLTASIWVFKHFFSLAGGGHCQANHRTGWKLKLAAVIQM